MQGPAGRGECCSGPRGPRTSSGWRLRRRWSMRLAACNRARASDRRRPPRAHSGRSQRCCVGCRPAFKAAVARCLTRSSPAKLPTRPTLSSRAG
eukprot:10078772-Alexandrium_andersonii.AAC.1